MLKLIMCQGLPGSGKTTWAIDQCKRLDWQAYRVNKDDIRRELEETTRIGTAPWTWSPEREKDVIAIRDSRIENALLTGFSVISDDCNFGRQHKVRLSELARKYGAEFVIQDFTKVSVDECVRRDALRTGKAQVGERVIRKMAATYLGEQVSNDPAFAYTRFAPVGVQDPKLPHAIICDLDGTLALFKGHRGPYDASTCAKDIVNQPVLDVIRALNNYRGWEVIYLSGREDKYRAPTLEFLRVNYCPEGALYMRETGDKRKDWIVKGELFDANVRGKHFIDLVLDDRNQVVDFWRHIGLTCFQVAAGAF